MANNDFNHSERNTIWTKYCGSASSAIDAFGRTMYKSDFECDHIYPKSLGGATNVSNGQPLSSKSNEEKSNNLSGTINGKRFSVERSNGVSKMYVNGYCVTK